MTRSFFSICFARDLYVFLNFTIKCGQSRIWPKQSLWQCLHCLVVILWISSTLIWCSSRVFSALLHDACGVLEWARTRSAASSNCCEDRALSIHCVTIKVNVRLFVWNRLYQEKSCNTQVSFSRLASIRSLQSHTDLTSNNAHARFGWQPIPLQSYLQWCSMDNAQQPFFCSRFLLNFHAESSASLTSVRCARARFLFVFFPNRSYLQ